jgi:hypothetical protein
LSQFTAPQGVTSADNEKIMNGMATSKNVLHMCTVQGGRRRINGPNTTRCISLGEVHRLPAKSIYHLYSIEDYVQDVLELASAFGATRSMAESSKAVVAAGL